MINKNKCTMALLGIISFLALVSFKPNEDWILFETANCRVMFPNSPKKDTSTNESAIGPITLHTYMYETARDSKDSNLIYGLIEKAYSSKLLESKDEKFVDDFFRTAIDASVEKMPGKLISEKKMEINKFPAREIAVNYGSGLAVIIMRMVLVNEKVLTVHTVSLTGREMNENSRRFLNSFEIK